MQPALKNDLVYCPRILDAIGKIELYANGYEDPFVFFDANDQKDFNACLLQLLHIGEQVNRLGESTPSDGNERSVDQHQRASQPDCT